MKKVPALIASLWCCAVLAGQTYPVTPQPQPTDLSQLSCLSVGPGGSNVSGLTLASCEAKFLALSPKAFNCTPTVTSEQWISTSNPWLYQVNITNCPNHNSLTIASTAYGESMQCLGGAIYDSANVSCECPPNSINPIYWDPVKQQCSVVPGPGAQQGAPSPAQIFGLNGNFTDSFMINAPATTWTFKASGPTLVSGGTSVTGVTVTDWNNTTHGSSSCNNNVCTNTPTDLQVNSPYIVQVTGTTTGGIGYHTYSFNGLNYVSWTFWTPAIHFGTSNGLDVTYQTNSASYYVNSGGEVFVQYRFLLSSKGSGNGQLYISIPFPNNSSAGGDCGGNGSFDFYNNSTNYTPHFGGVAEVCGGVIQMLGPNGWMTNSDFSNTSIWVLNVHYLQ